MSNKKAWNPVWSWWVRCGERLMLGLGLEAVLEEDGSLRGGAERAGVASARAGLRSGQAVVGALRGSGLRLPLEAWSLLEAGEHTGRLGEAMREVGHMLEARQARRRELTGQLWYPLMVGCAGLGVMGLILLWVVPEMREMSGAMGLGDKLPWLTEHIGRLYGLILAAGLGLVLAVAGGLAGLRWLGRRSARWGLVEERLLGAVPLVGGLRRRVREARLLRQLGTLLGGGTTLPRALEMVAEAVPNRWEAEELRLFRSRLLMGAGFADGLAGCALIAPEDAVLLRTGQEGGRLETYMERIAADLEQQVNWSIRQATRLMEPLFLLGLSGAIGGLVLAYLLPMIQMLEQAGGF
jgi:general secretion pathway protein F